MNRLLFDGGTGWQLPRENVLGSLPANLSAPDKVKGIGKSFVAAGAQALTTNSLCAPRAFEAGWHEWNRAVEQAIDLARQAEPQLLFLSLGSPEDACTIGPFCRAIKSQLPKTDGVLLETQTDINKAVLMARALRDAGASRLIVSFVPDPEFAVPAMARPFAERAVCLLEDCADGLGFNCGCGDALFEGLKELWMATSLPLLARPNAGIPRQGKYPLTDTDFAQELCICARLGATLLGGCCGVDAAMLNRSYQVLHADTEP